MADYNNKINNLLNALERYGVKEIARPRSAPDEPKMYMFQAQLQNPPKLSDGTSWNGSAGGFSFHSKRLALLKCLCEAAERFSNTTYKENSLVYSSYQNLKENALNPKVYSIHNTVMQKTLAWTTGYDLLKGSKCSLPSQLVYFNYKLKPGEPVFGELNSTGAAGGFDHESTLLRGIYEIIERDAFMTTYLTQTKAPKIDLTSLKSSKVKHIVEQTQRYNLELCLFDLTNDLGIPSFMNLLIDKTGLGPIISVGLKASLSVKKAIIGALEESFYSRPWIKRELFSNRERYDTLDQSEADNLLGRGLLWVHPKMLKKLFFLLNQPFKKIKIPKFNLTNTQELELAKRKLADKKYSIYYADITTKDLRKIGFVAYKVIIPEVQPLFLSENKKLIKKERLQSVARHFGKKHYNINLIPHPFL